MTNTDRQKLVEEMEIALEVEHMKPFMDMLINGTSVVDHSQIFNKYAEAALKVIEQRYELIIKQDDQSKGD